MSADPLVWAWNNLHLPEAKATIERHVSDLAEDLTEARLALSRRSREIDRLRSETRSAERELAAAKRVKVGLRTPGGNVLDFSLILPEPEPGTGKHRIDDAPFDLDLLDEDNDDYDF